MATARPAKRRSRAPTPEQPSATETTFHPKGAVTAPNTEPEPEHLTPGRFPKEAVAWLFILGAFSYGLGWYLAYTGAIVVFRASDVALAAIFILLLRALARITRSRIPSDGLGIPSAAIAKAGAWSLGAFWTFWTLTNVPQLAIGVSGAIFIYQGYATRARLRRESYAHATRFGPAFAPVVAVFIAYAVWLGARSFFGPMPGFDLVTAGAAVVFTIVTLRIMDRRACRAAATPRKRTNRVPDGVRRGLERRTIIGVIAGYLFFRFFISSTIPYGPIVEWFIVCVGAVFIAIIMADRIGVVPTRRSLPAPSVRTHIQRIVSLPDRALEETDQHLAAFISRGQHADWVVDRFRALFHEAGVPEEVAVRHLGPETRTEGRRRDHLAVTQMGRDARERFIHMLIETLQTARTRGATGTLKTGPGVRREDKGRRPVVVPPH